ncbi:venom dipeptidyl peptidase 4-like isoform X2 [Venturia canescens]|uniref:venom dipeptidyl peptidase 4-like isoform X2 n=1 Tax=Venturia canescens TaxID=32260 RepID=UPI001C9D1452|nr:venom dipeptidyl peptidase 4-like isoform X2 [Venturia canescens]XP_043274699.1 venom dipeptidyl peptidase 4-like isoform X2 [Venturia canescens]XP_043274700.1 venom dipeptidyl peptidase 4-like isoform X2 [Venturia canescens]XP_043274701.1 venom dipeptidyl peptidase 4-like isoform X2 [Venturia canescens]XP_043274702.1 venom dipeptidyl peptidase 4-like isoform X2 [Venturia canescens]
MTESGLTISEAMTKNKHRNWRRWIGGVLVGIVVLGLIIAAIILLSGRPANSTGARTSGPSGAAVTFDEWLWGSFLPKSFNGTWISDDEILYRDDIGNLIIFNVSSSSPKYILNATNAALVRSFDHQISADRKYLLFASNYQKYFRYTYLAQYTIVNLETLAETLLTVGNSTNLQLATWAPQGNGLVYVSQNNIFYRPEPEINNDYQITSTGIFGSIYNGVPDWVYEEEVLSSNKAMWFSPDGKKLAFAYFDDSNTPIMNIPFYGYPGSLSFQYTSAIPIHYPKPGTVNPSVKLYYVDLEAAARDNVTLHEIKHPAELSYTERILASVAFPTDNIIASTWMNRVQSKAYFSFYNLEASNDKTALAYEESNGWVEQFESPHFSNDGTAFLLILPQEQSDNTSWRHLVIVNNTISEKPTVTALTSGTFVVTEIVSWDQKNSLIYYLATTESDSGQQHLYRLSTIYKKTECLSCNVKNEDTDSNCLYNTATFSTNNGYYILTCAGPAVPTNYIFDNKNAKKIFIWEDNKAVVDLMATKAKPLVKRTSVPLPGGFEAQTRMIIPSDADLTGFKKYPMVVYVYGGPDTYQVTEKFNVDWGTYLVTHKNIIYAAIDGRGSGLKGNAMLFAGYRNLGTVEIFDQINVTRHLQNEFPFIDRQRTAIWGWSYGGYAAGMSLAMDLDGVFKCGMSVAPVTDWALYDSIYTERFMGLPTVTDNIGGYEQARLLNKAQNIKSNSYYLIHGTLDDNVHYQQSLMLAKVLEQKDILFRQQTYTDEDHGIAQYRSHLYHSLENFLDGCFDL